MEREIRINVIRLLILVNVKMAKIESANVSFVVRVSLFQDDLVSFITRKTLL